MFGPVLWQPFCVHMVSGGATPLCMLLMGDGPVQPRVPTPGLPVTWHSPPFPRCACAGVILLIIAVVIPTVPIAAMMATIANIVFVFILGVKKVYNIYEVLQYYSKNCHNKKDYKFYI